MNGSQTKTHRTVKLWVPAVLAIGIIAGIALSFVAQAQEAPLSPFQTEPILRYHLILTTVTIALLVSLVVVYGKIYIETRANFALGLVIVLATLLVHSVLSSPLLLATPPLGEPPPIGRGIRIQGRDIIPPADILTIIAYTVFLYLSLE